MLARSTISLRSSPVIGLDLLEIERLEQALERRPRLADRLFTDAERAYAAREGAPGPAPGRPLLRQGGRGQGAGAGGLELHGRGGRGHRRGARACACRVRPSAAPLELDVGVRLSLTHTETTAGAVALAL